MKCKTFLGSLVCKVKATGSLMQFPSNLPTQNRPTVTIYTSKSCSICNPLVEQNLRQLRPIRNLVTPRIVDIDQLDRGMSDQVLALPSIQIGNDHIGSNPSEERVLTTLRKYIPTSSVK